MTTEPIDWPTLFDVVEQDPHLIPAPLSTVERIITDRLRGHIVLHGAPEHRGAGKPAESRDAAFADLGPVLHLWSGQGCALGPQQARDLAEALTWWADRSER